MKYRATFSDGPMGSKSNNFDFEAKDKDEAWEKVYARPEAKMHDIYTDVMLEGVPDGPKIIGIKFAYDDSRRGHTQYYQYMTIRALDEAQAVDYYNQNIKGKSFFQPWPYKIDEDGNCTYGAVRETYFAACPGYNFDATM